MLSNSEVNIHVVFLSEFCRIGKHYQRLILGAVSIGRRNTLVFY